jgi:NADH:ubiquinone oxidoreductase subunit F (NADH-binding)
MKDYRRSGGFAALERCRDELTPTQVIDVIEAAGCAARRRVFPTGRKWRAVAQARAASDAHTAKCGQQWRRGRPRRVHGPNAARILSVPRAGGDVVALHAVGAVEGVLYIPHEYPLA